MLGKGIENFDKFINDNVDSVKDIWNIVKDFKYGIYDYKTKGYIKYDDFDYEHDHDKYRVLSPEETLKYKFGVCWDQSLCIAYLANKANLKYDYHFVSDHTNSSVHTFVFIKENNKWWYPESSYYTLGLHGPFDDYDSATAYFVKQHRKTEKSYFLMFKNNINVTKLFDDKHISAEKFLKVMGVKDYLIKLFWSEPWWEGSGIVKKKTTFDYDKFFRVTKIHYPDGTTKNWDYNNGIYKK